jgi:hypothetical protein
MAAIDLEARNVQIVAGATLKTGRDVLVLAIAHEKSQAEFGKLFGEQITEAEGLLEIVARNLDGGFADFVGSLGLGVHASFDD